MHHLILGSKLILKLPVNNSLIRSESKHTGFGVPLLRFGSDCAHFNEAKSHLVQPVYSLAVFVEACRNPNRVFELQPEDVHFLYIQRNT